MDADRDARLIAAGIRPAADPSAWSRRTFRPTKLRHPLHALGVRTWDRILGWLGVWPKPETFEPWDLNGDDPPEPVYPPRCEVIGRHVYAIFGEAGTMRCAYCEAIADIIPREPAPESIRREPGTQEEE
jgi:hypothetical protein